MRCTLRRRTRASVTELGYEFPESASYCSHSRDLSTRTQSPASRDPSWSVEMTEIGGRAVAEAMTTALYRVIAAHTATKSDKTFTAALALAASAGPWRRFLQTRY